MTEQEAKDRYTSEELSKLPTLFVDDDINLLKIENEKYRIWLTIYPPYKDEITIETLIDEEDELWEVTDRYLD